MANINRSWKKVMAVGCSHGDLANKKIQKQVLEFADRYKPVYRFELGDVVDTAAFRHGAKGTSDESKSIDLDFFAGLRWLRDYSPTHITWGNHDARLCELRDSPNAIVSHAASRLWNDLQDEARKLKALTKDYDYEHNWFELGGTFWGHGFWYNTEAVRDHAEYLGGPVVMAHLHRPMQVQGRTRMWTPSFCVGTLSNIDQMHYARRRRATSQWGHGCVWGEVSDTKAELHLTCCEKDGTLRFPI